MNHLKHLPSPLPGSASQQTPLPSLRCPCGSHSRPQGWRRSWGQSMAASFCCSLFLTVPLLLPPQFPQLWCPSQAVIPSDMSPAPPGGPCSFLWCLPPFHNRVLTEVPQALLIGPGAPRAPPIGSALPCSWSGVEPAGAGWNQLEPAHTEPFHWPLYYEKLAIYAQYTWKKKFF